MDSSIISTVIPLVLVLGILIAIRQLTILEQSYRFNTAPFVTFDIEESTDRMPPSTPTLGKHLIKFEELSKWARGKPRAPHRYMILRLQNKQTHIAGAATDVRFRVVFQLPQYGTPNTMTKVGFRIRKEIFMDAEELYRIIFADLKGVDTAVIDIDKIEYYDVNNNKYKKSYGFFHWELDNRGVESGLFKAC